MFIPLGFQPTASLADIIYKCIFVCLFSFSLCFCIIFPFLLFAFFDSFFFCFTCFGILFDSFCSLLFFVFHIFPFFKMKVTHNESVDYVLKTSNEDAEPSRDHSFRGTGAWQVSLQMKSLACTNTSRNSSNYSRFSTKHILYTIFYTSIKNSLTSQDAPRGTNMDFPELQCSLSTTHI